jgi:uncharacterized protein (TIGR03083 family)
VTNLTDEIAAERRALAAMLADLAAETWDAPTLCAGWRVREVVAHMTMPFRYSAPKFVFELVKARGDFNRMADRCARRDAAMTADRLVAALRDNATRQWKPPGGGLQGALTHDVVHGLDITVALGDDRRVPIDRLRIVLAGLTTPRSFTFFKLDLAGIELRANDTDWSYGAGTPLSATAQDLTLVLTGRKLAPGRLQGEPAGRFTVA